MTVEIAHERDDMSFLSTRPARLRHQAQSNDISHNCQQSLLLPLRHVFQRWHREQCRDALQSRTNLALPARQWRNPPPDQG